MMGMIEILYTWYMKNIWQQVTTHCVKYRFFVIVPLSYMGGQLLSVPTVILNTFSNSTSNYALKAFKLF